MGLGDGKVACEPIDRDQASLPVEVGLPVQVGLFDPNGLPVAGAATAARLLDPALPGNTLMPQQR